MGWAIRCKNCGLRDFVDNEGTYRCPNCGKKVKAYRCGLPPKTIGMPNVIDDTLPKRYDMELGTVITSRSQRDRVAKEKGLEIISVQEWKDKHPEIEPVSKKAFSYKGQIDRRSTAERRHVRNIEAEIW
ncbi:MAG: hypothetical protein DRN20_00530 [Thermoplasmata archaeon]|nr:MAG: hypothetical protein DRN20_00530 [Thermoplasmata archaeon]